MLAESWRQDPDREHVWRFRDQARPEVPIRRARATPRPSPTRCASTAIRSRRRSTRSSGETSPGVRCRGRRGPRRAPRAERRHAAAAPLLALGDPQPGGAPGGRRGVRPDDVRRHRAIHASSSRSPGRISTSPAGRATAVPARRGRSNNGPAHLDGIRWIPILDDRERAAALERGELDCLQNASLLDVDRLRGEPGDRGDRVPAVGARLHGPRPRGRSAGDVRVRRAISLAIDRNALVERDLEGHGWPAFSPIPSHSQWYAPEVEAAGGFDPREAARAARRGGVRAGARRRPARARDGGRERRHRPPRRRGDPRDARGPSASGSSSR